MFTCSRTLFQPNSLSHKGLFRNQLWFFAARKLNHSNVLCTMWEQWLQRRSPGHSVGILKQAVGSELAQCLHLVFHSVSSIHLGFRITTGFWPGPACNTGRFIFPGLPNGDGNPVCSIYEPDGCLMLQAEVMPAGAAWKERWKCRGHRLRRAVGSLKERTVSSLACCLCNIPS